MKDPDAKRRWLFLAEDFEDELFYLDAEGKVCRDEPIEFIGTDAEALAEGDRRADRWEEANMDCLARITRESHGRLKES